MTVRSSSTQWLAGPRLPVLFAIVVTLALAAQAGAVVRLVYPVLAVGIGLRLLKAGTADYVKFVMWLWVLSPLVRRIADFQAGWQNPSLVLLTPYLVTSLCAVHVAARLLLTPHAVRPSLPVGTTAFALAVLGTVVGVPMGLLLRNPDAVQETLNWLIPVGLGAYVASCPTEIDRIERTVVRTFAQQAIVVGAYGVYQFFSLPGWDANWMLNSEMRSIGFAESFAVRVFSTLHSPGVLGYFIFVPLVFWLARPRIAGLGVVCMASVTLLLSQVRTAWLGFAISALLILPTLRLVSGVRILLFVLLGALCVTPFLQLPEVSDRVNARLESIKDLPSYDNSAVSRLAGHVLTFDFAARHPFGAGIGAAPAGIEREIGMRDSIVIAGLVQFGILGMLLHVVSLSILGVILVRAYRLAHNPDAVGVACVGLGMLSTVALGIPNAGPPGVILWLLGGLSAARLAARQPSPRRSAAATVHAFPRPATAIAASAGADG